MDLFRNVFQEFATPRHQANFGAMRGNGKSNGFADAAAGSRHHGNLTLETLHDLVVASAGLAPKLCFAGYHWCNAASRCEAVFSSLGGFYIFHEGEEAFGERGMDVDGALQERVGLFREHESAENLHEFASFGGEDGSAEDTVVRSIDDNFHEAGGFAALDGARNVSHGASANFKFKTFGASFFFG